MGFFDKLKDMPASVSDQFSGLNNTRKLTGQLKTTDAAIQDLIHQVGLRVVEQHLHDETSEYKDLFDQIIQLQNQSQSIKNEMDRLKQMQEAAGAERQREREERLAQREAERQQREMARQQAMAQQQYGQNMNGYQQQYGQDMNGYQQQYGQDMNGYQQQYGQDMNGYQQQYGQDMNGYQQQYGQDMNGYQQQYGQDMNGYQQQYGQDMNGYQQQYGQNMNGYQQQYGQDMNGYQQQYGQNMNGYQQQYGSASNRNSGAVQTCQRCGNKNDMNSTFCIYCGNPLGAPQMRPASENPDSQGYEASAAEDVIDVEPTIPGSNHEKKMPENKPVELEK